MGSIPYNYGVPNGCAPYNYGVPKGCAPYLRDTLSRNTSRHQIK